MRPAPFTDAADPLPHRAASAFAKVAVAMRQRSWRGRQAHGLTPTQSQLLAALYARRPAPQRLGALALELQVSAPTASDALSALERKGLAQRGPDPHDRRATAVTLTRTGEIEAEAAAEAPDFLLRALDSLPEAEQTALMRALMKLLREMQERGDIAPARMCVGCAHFRPVATRDPERPHHCAAIETGFGDRHLRVDCGEYDPAPHDLRHINWARFSRRPA